MLHEAGRAPFLQQVPLAFLSLVKRKILNQDVAASKSTIPAYDIAYKSGSKLLA
jgi:hypothetical protein